MVGRYNTSLYEAVGLLHGSPLSLFFGFPYIAHSVHHGSNVTIPGRVDDNKLTT